MSASSLLLLIPTSIRSHFYRQHGSRDFWRTFVDLEIHRPIYCSENGTCAQPTYISYRRSRDPVANGRVGRLHTRLFLFVLFSYTISIGIYLCLSEENQQITVLNPFVKTYQALYRAHGTTLTCPCSRYVQEYRKLINVTYRYHQVCSSDLVSQGWLDYLRLFDPMEVNVGTESDFARDFRSYGLLYFQLLSSFCSMVRTNVEDAQATFGSTLFVNSHLLSPDVYREQIVSVADTFIRTTHDQFLQMLNWIDVANQINSFLTGNNMNSQMSLVDNEARMKDSQYYVVSNIDNDDVVLSGVCSCGYRAIACRLALLMYVNASEPLRFSRHLKEIPLGCIPLDGLMRSESNWWYDDGYMEMIRDTYALVIPAILPPLLQPLNGSIESKFRGQKVSELLKNTFVETVATSKIEFGTFYHQCAPISCSYAIVSRRYLWLIVLLLASICDGLNEGLRLLIPLVGKWIGSCIRWWKNRSSRHSQPRPFLRHYIVSLR